MPATPLRDLVTTAFAEWDVGRSVDFGSDRHFDLIDQVAATFAVSRDAAGLRLLKLGYTGTPPD